jgi:hypothetical protein
MKTIIETTQLEFNKSNFIVDLVEHDNGLLYIEIVQSITSSKEGNSSIKINPDILTDMIKGLQNYLNKDF